MDLLFCFKSQKYRPRERSCVGNPSSGFDAHLPGLYPLPPGARVHPNRRSDWIEGYAQECFSNDLMVKVCASLVVTRIYLNQLQSTCARDRILSSDVPGLDHLSFFFFFFFFCSSKQKIRFYIGARQIRWNQFVVGSHRNEKEYLWQLLLSSALSRKK